MPYQVKLAETVSKRVAGFHPELEKRTKKALTEISQNPYAGKELQEDLKGYLSFRFKRYRVIYTEKTVTVYLISHRRDVYELSAKLVGS